MRGSREDCERGLSDCENEKSLDYYAGVDIIMKSYCRI